MVIVVVIVLGVLVFLIIGFVVNSKILIIVGFKSFIESKVVSEIYVLVLEKVGYKVICK